MLSEAGQLAPDGGNLANAFATLPRGTQAAVATELSRLTSVFADVGTVPTHDGNHSLRFQDRWSDVWYTPYEVSDGTILLLAYLLLQHQTPAVDVIAIEEPDRGLHPYLMGQLVALLRAMSEGKIGGRPVQILLATHSPELLDHLRPEEVRFVSRDRADGAVQVKQIAANDPHWEVAFKEYRESLGSVWLAGGLGGVPGE
jgi:predicted ATPase